MSALREAAQQALEAWNTGDLRVLGPAMGALRAALAQERAEPAQEQAVTDDMRSAVRWAPSSAYWSERLREFFGPDAREGINALERRLAKAQKPKGGGNLPPPLQAEPDLSRCPQCNGPADNGHDRSIPPSPYLCTKCMAEPEQEPVAKCIDDICSEHLGRVETFDHLPKGTLLYTIFPRRTMVPLTEAEIECIAMTHQSLRQVARAIEKASWEKNHGQA